LIIDAFNVFCFNRVAVFRTDIDVADAAHAATGAQEVLDTIQVEVADATGIFSEPLSPMVFAISSEQCSGFIEPRRELVDFRMHLDPPYDRRWKVLAAFKYATTRGCGAFGCEQSCGKNSVATKNGWPDNSTILASPALSVPVTLSDPFEKSGR
jgi:hypothetical protein